MFIDASFWRVLSLRRSEMYRKRIYSKNRCPCSAFDMSLLWSEPSLLKLRSINISLLRSAELKFGSLQHNNLAPALIGTHQLQLIVQFNSPAWLVTQINISILWQRLICE
jgi:hypothetical protein